MEHKKTSEGCLWIMYSLCFGAGVELPCGDEEAMSKGDLKMGE